MLSSTKFRFARKNFSLLLISFLIYSFTIFAQWHPQQPLTNLKLNGACYSSGQKIFVVGEFDSIYSSTNNGSTWQSNYIPNTSTLNSLCFIDDTIGYVVGDNGKIFRINFSTMLSEDISIANFFHLLDVTFLDYYNGIVVGTKQVRIDGRIYFLPSIHITTDAGLNWVEECFDVRGKLNSVSFYGEENFIAVGDNGKALILRGIGNNWEPLELNINTNLYDVKLCQNGTVIIVGGQGTIVISEDGWHSWNNIIVPEYYHIKSICTKDSYQFVAAGYMRVRIDGRDFNVATIFNSDDGGVHWNECFISERGTFNCVSFCDPDLGIAIGDSGLVAVYEASTSFIEDSDIGLTDFIVEQNFPNPFNPATTIKYQIPQRTNVSLKIYDTIGNEIAELVNEEQEVGYYNFEFNAAKLSSGIYFYRLQAGSFIETKKMVLIK